MCKVSENERIIYNLTSQVYYGLCCIASKVQYNCVILLVKCRIHMFTMDCVVLLSERALYKAALSKVQ